MSSMKKNVVLFALFFLMITSCAPKKYFSFNRGEAIQSKYFAEIPFEEVTNLMIIPAEINGKTYRFIFDTGATNIISEKLYKELNLPVLDKQSMVDQSGKKDTALVVNLRSIALGGITFQNTPTVVLNDSNFFLQCFNIDGFIGSNMLRNSVVRISVPEKIIILTDNLQKLNLNIEHSGKLFLTPIQSAPYFWTDLESGKKGRVQLFFDSGMQDLLNLSEEQYDFFKKRNIFEEIGVSAGSNSMGFFGQADDIKTYKLLLPLMKINKISMENAIVTTNPSYISRMGAKILEYAIVTLDYRNKRIYFEPLSFDNTIDVYEETFPISPSFQDNKLIVGFVWDEALKEKIEVGDRILLVDDVDSKNITPCDWVHDNLFSKKDKTMLTIEKSDGSIYKVEIEKK